MPFSPSVTDRERDKFTETTEGETAVRVTLNATPGSTPITVENSVPALTGTMTTTTMLVSDTAIPIPPVAAIGRRAISILVKSLTDVLYIGSNNSITADSIPSGTGGWEIGPNETFNTDIQDSVSIYAIAESGKTITIKILEIS